MIKYKIQRMKKLALVLLCLLVINSAQAQCTAPSYTIDLSAQTDTTWILYNTPRGGNCCGSPNCVTFNVTTNPGSELISFDVTNPSPSGSAYYQVNCGPPISIGTPLCTIGLASPFTITYCKPGGDHPDYVISAGTVVHASADISIQKISCVDTLFVGNAETSSITWTSIYPGAQGAYNSYLSCTSGCNSTIVTPGPNPPAYVDFKVCGNPSISCGSFKCDTVRVYFVPNITATITPANPIICSSSGTSVTLTVNATGGAPPYDYQWSAGPQYNQQSFTTNVAGTYTVTVGDKTKCPKVSFVKTIASQPSATFTFTSSNYCKNGTNPSPIYLGTGQAGSFSALPAGLIFVSATTGEINLATSTAGTYTITNSIPAAGGCPGTSASATVSIDPFPVMTSVSSATICSGSTVNIPLTSSLASNYTWIASDNVNTSGESLTTQTTATLSNTILNNIGSQQNVVYTITPTATVSGGCTGTPQTVIVVVNPMDNPSFVYSPATFCQTGTNPTPVISGLSGGTFSGTGGLVFTNTTTGTINLMASGVGSYTVTYTTNGVCPNSQSVPVTITTAPSAAFSYIGTPFCQNTVNPLPTFGVGASGGTFTSTAGLVFVNSGTGEVNLSASTPGTYIITNTIPASGGCAVSTATTSITITQLKVATFNYTGSPYCKNGTNPSPAYSGGGVAGTFTSQAGLSINASTGLVNLGASTAGTYTVTNTIAATGGCPAVVATSTIQITALPVASFTYNATPYCQTAANPSPVFFGGGVAGAFSGSSVFLNINSSTGTIDLANSQAGGYIITNTIPAAAGCPQVTATASVAITALPLGSFSYSANPYCQSSTDPTPVLVSGGTNGNYSGSPAGLSIDLNSGTVDLSASTTGTYTVTNNISAAGGCPAVINTATITINPLPIATFTYATPYCQNAVDPSPTYLGGGVAGTFTATTGLVVNAGNGTVNLLGSTIGSSTVTNTIAAANGCPLVTASAVITINPIATAAAGSAATICSGTTYTLSGSIGGGASSLTWTTSGNGSFSNASLANAAYTPSVADITAGTVTLTITTNDPAGPCAAVSSSMILTINPAAVVNAGANASICAGTTYTLAGSFSGGASGITWTTSGSGTFSSASSTTAVYTPSASDLSAGTVTLTISSNDPTGPCGIVSDAMVLTLTPKDNPAFSYTGATFCQTGTDPMPTISGLPGGSFSGNPGTLVINAANGTVDLSASPLGSYTVTYLTAGVCPNSSSQLLTITVAPSAAFSYTATPFCTSGADPLPVFPVGASGGLFTSGGTLVINSVTGQIDLSASTPGNYTVTNTIAAAGGCAVAVATTTLTINQEATVNANADQNICYGSAVVLTGSVSGSATSGTWSGGTGSYSPGAGTLGATYTPTSADSTAGTFTLTLTTNDPAGVCPAVNDQMVITIDQPAVALANANQTICYGSTVLLAGSIGGAATAGTWTGGSGTYTPDPNTLGATYTPTAADSAAGSITLTLTTDDPAGVCPSVSDPMTITIDQPATIDANADQTICYGSNVILAGVAGGSVSGGTWTGGSGSYSPGAGTLGATYTPNSADSTTGNITLTLTSDDPAGVCPAVIDQMTITIDQPATVNASNNQTICFGDTVSLAGAIGGSATSATWTGGTGAFVPDSITLGAVYVPTSSDSTAGSVTLTLTTNDPAGVCPAVNDQVLITINQPVTVNAGSNQTICYGTNVVLNGSIGGSATSGTWTGGAGTYTPDNITLGATYIPSATDSLAQIAILTLTTDDPSGVCPALTDVMVISINAPATAYANVDQVVCFGDTVFLAGNVGGIVNTGTWTGGTGTFSPDSITLAAGYIPSSADSAAGTITLTLTSDDPISVCPAVSDQMTITINQPAVANASVDQTICYGSAVVLTGSIGGSASSATWNGGTGTFTPGPGTLGATYTPTSTDSTAGTVTLTLTTDDPSGVCNAVTDTMVITINQPATAAANTDQTICYGAQVVLAGSIGGSATSGTWTGGAGTFTPNDSTLGAAYTPVAADSIAGSVTLTLTTNDPAGVCNAVSDQMTITINIPPIAAVTPNDISCFGLSNGSVTLQVTGGVPTFTYSWSNGSTSQNLSSVVAGTYSVVVTDGNNCKDTAFVTLNEPTDLVSAIDSVSNYNGYSVSCNGSTNGNIGISVSGGVTTYTYTWSNGSLSEDQSNIGAATYSVVITDANGCNDTLFATLTQPPVVAATGTVTSNFTGYNVSCYGSTNGTIGVTPFGGVPGYTYQWSNSSTTQNQTGLGTGSYSVIVSDTNSCQDTLTFVLTQPDSISATDSIQHVLCNNFSNGSIDQTISGGASPYVYIWSNGASTEDISGLSNGSYSVTVADQNGCIATFNYTVTETSPIVSGLAANSVSCYNQMNGSISGSVSGGTPAYTYSWTTGSTQPTLSNIGAGTYIVTVTDANNCVLMDTLVVSQPDSLNASITSPVLDNGSNVSGPDATDGTIISAVTGGTPLYIYNWSNGATTANLTSVPAGSYTLIVTDANGCVDTVTILLTEPNVLEMPSGFSPNGDGLNDLFVVHGLSVYPQNLLSIYNRWGNLVYEKENYNNTWDGKSNTGADLPDGTYFVILKLNANKGNTEKTLTGYVDLRR